MAQDRSGQAMSRSASSQLVLRARGHTGLSCFATPLSTSSDIVARVSSMIGWNGFDCTVVSWRTQYNSTHSQQADFAPSPVPEGSSSPASSSWVWTKSTTSTCLACGLSCYPTRLLLLWISLGWGSSQEPRQTQEYAIRTTECGSRKWHPKSIPQLETRLSPLKVRTRQGP